MKYLYRILLPGLFCCAAVMNVKAGAVPPANDTLIIFIDSIAYTGISESARYETTVDNDHGMIVFLFDVENTTADTTKLTASATAVFMHAVWEKPTLLPGEHSWVKFFMPVKSLKDYTGPFTAGFWTFYQQNGTEVRNSITIKMNIE